MVGELYVDGLAPEDWSYCSVVAHHSVSRLFCAHFYESLVRDYKGTKVQPTLSPNILDSN